MTAKQFADALGVVESNGNPYAPMGDGGRALGRWQIHPDELWTWAHRLALAPELGETWDSFIERVVWGFYQFHTTLSAVEVAMTWHIGHVVRENDVEWDDAYADRFNAAITGLNTA